MPRPVLSTVRKSHQTAPSKRPLLVLCARYEHPGRRLRTPPPDERERWGTAKQALPFCLPQAGVFRSQPELHVP